MLNLPFKNILHKLHNLIREKSQVLSKTSITGKTTAIVIQACTVVSNKAKGLGKALPGQASTHSKHTVHSSQICFSHDIAENNKMGWEKSVVIFASHSQRVIKTENHFSTDMQN